MEIIMIFGIVIVGFIILAIGGGIGYWLWIASRGTKMTWKALVYQVGDGEIKYLDKYTLAELKPYTEDVIEKVDKKNGATHYWLQKLRKATPVVTAECVEVWSNNNKVVRVLLEGDTCTLLKPGYDKQIGGMIFKPMPHDRINMIKTEQAERKERIQDKKDVLTAILPYVSVGITMIALVIGIYVMVQGAIKVSEYQYLSSEKLGDSINRLSSATLQLYGYDETNLNNTDGRVLNKGGPPVTLPP